MINKCVFVHKSLVTSAPERVKLLTMNTDDGEDVCSEVCSSQQLSHRLGKMDYSKYLTIKLPCLLSTTRSSFPF